LLKVRLTRSLGDPSVLIGYLAMVAFRRASVVALISLLAGRHSKRLKAGEVANLGRRALEEGIETVGSGAKEPEEGVGVLELADLALAPEEQFRTCGGDSNGAPCQFPFVYAGVTYHSCTTVGADAPWCYVDNKGNYGYCNCGEHCTTVEKWWKDSGNHKCSDYVKYDWCTKSGGYGPGWEADWGPDWTFADDGNAGYDATTACCACQAPSPIPEPTPETPMPTPQPTPEPTPEPTEKPMLEAGLYFKVISQTCEHFGYGDITSEKECAEAAGKSVDDIVPVSARRRSKPFACGCNMKKGKDTVELAVSSSCDAKKKCSKKRACFCVS